jgi:hypothetical protein
LGFRKLQTENQGGIGMNLTVSELEELYFEGAIEKDGKTFEVVEEGEWVHEHKSQSLELIFTDGESFYAGYIGRSGSPFTDWTYDSEIYGADDQADVAEVEKQEVTIVKWVAK